MLDGDVLDITIVVGRTVEHLQTAIDREVVVDAVSGTEGEAIIILAATHK